MSNTHTLVGKPSANGLVTEPAADLYPPPSWDGPSTLSAFYEAEVAKAKNAMQNGADDSAWKPGDTAVDALIKRTYIAEAKLRFVKTALAALQKTDKLTQDQLAFVLAVLEEV